MQTPSSGDDQARPKAQAIFARRILPGMVALLVVALAAAAVAVVHIARRIDHDALEQSHFLAGKALQAQHDWMNRSIVDYAFWGDAYVHLNGQVDVDWAYVQANLGPSLYRDFGYEAVLVVNPAGETLYSVLRGKLQPVESQQYLQHGLPELLARAHAAVADDAGVSALLWVDDQPPWSRPRSCPPAAPVSQQATARHPSCCSSICSMPNAWKKSARNMPSTSCASIPPASGMARISSIPWRTVRPCLSPGRLPSRGNCCSG
ncbi:sensory box protein [Pseudomonas sp. BAY1663]|nr:sensory box protein [Pseudomonas sp. BAY1663]